MTRKEARETEAMLDRLAHTLAPYCADERITSVSAIDIARLDAEALRRISMTLHRWHEMECGTDDGCIERHNPGNKPYWHVPGRYQRPIPDREAGARKRLAKIMARYPTLTAYVQTDPRGCALYILRPGDVPAGADVSSYYSRGVAVHR